LNTQACHLEATVSKWNTMLSIFSKLFSLLSFPFLSHRSTCYGMIKEYMVGTEQLINSTLRRAVSTLSTPSLKREKPLTKEQSALKTNLDAKIPVICQILEEFSKFRDDQVQVHPERSSLSLSHALILSLSISLLSLAFFLSFLIRNT